MKLKILYIILFLYSNHLVAQNRGSLFVGVGIAMSSNATVTEGSAGLLHGIGHQKELGNGKIRFNTQFTFGSFDNRSVNGGRDSHFSSRNIKFDFDFNLFSMKSFCAFIGSGLSFNLTSGYAGPLTGLPPSTPWNPSQRAFYFTDTHFGFNGSLGFRLAPLSKQFAYELRLFEASFQPTGYPNFTESSFLKFNLIYHLGSKKIASQ